MLRVIGASVQGARHEKLSEPLQDAFMSMVDRDKLYVSIADGHGSKLHFRSHIGSSLAVIAGSEILQHHADQIAKQGSLEERRQGAVNVITAIIAHWSKLCLKELRAQPFRTDELVKLGQEDKEKLSKNALLAYGTTLTCFVNKRNLVYGFSIGDGDVLALKGAEVLSLTEDDRLLGDETYSLTSPDVYKNLKYFEADRLEMSPYLLATDGYRKSFATKIDFFSVLKDMKKYLDNEGEKLLETKLEGWLQETTKGGSGDDITCCLLF